jgi:hypothetical protein
LSLDLHCILKYQGSMDHRAGCTSTKADMAAPVCRSSKVQSTCSCAAAWCIFDSCIGKASAMQHNEPKVDKLVHRPGDAYRCAKINQARSLQQGGGGGEDAARGSMHRMALVLHLRWTALIEAASTLVHVHELSAELPAAMLLNARQLLGRTLVSSYQSASDYPAASTLTENRDIDDGCKGAGPA